jgi:hypothetical protein
MNGKCYVYATLRLKLISGEEFINLEEEKLNL